MDTTTTKAIDDRPVGFKITKLLGPGLMVAAAGIGAGDLVAATLGGAGFGLTFLWVVALAAFLKLFLNEGIGRWQLATETTALEGWATQMPAFVKIFFGFYLVVWTVSVSASLSNACGLGIATITGGAVPQTWGAVGHALLGLAFVMIGGFASFEKVMKILITIMFFTIISCAVLSFDNPGAFFEGLLIPRLPSRSGSTVLSVLGGIGGSVTMLSYNYWLREEKMVGPRWVNYIRADISIGYIFTAVFGIAVMSMANQAFFVSGITITNAQAVSKMAETLRTALGPLGFYAYALGFWAAVTASLLGVWQSVPYLFADFWGLIRKYPRTVRQELTKVTSTPYRLALVYVTISALPFAFMRQPLFIIKTYTIIGSLFIPFLAGTLLYLNNVKLPAHSGVRKNSVLTNAVMTLALILFGYIGIRELLNAAFGIQI
jgi:Mn2+/Fe2+ NRAMP family transporter